GHRRRRHPGALDGIARRHRARAGEGNALGRRGAGDVQRRLWRPARQAPESAGQSRMNAVELRDICVAAAEAGARVLRDLYDRPREVSFKGRIDLVTDADRAAEERVLSVLHERVPGARVLAEESGETGAASGERFIVDPLDGT